VALLVMLTSESQTNHDGGAILVVSTLSIVTYDFIRVRWRESFYSSIFKHEQASWSVYLFFFSATVLSYYNKDIHAVFREKKRERERERDTHFERTSR